MHNFERCRKSAGLARSARSRFFDVFGLWIGFEVAGQIAKIPAANSKNLNFPGKIAAIPAIPSSFENFANCRNPFNFKKLPQSPQSLERKFENFLEKFR